MKLINENEVVNGGVTLILYPFCSDESCMCSYLSISFLVKKKKGRGNT